MSEDPGVHRIATTRCPTCGYTFDAVGDLTEDSPPPSPGDLTVCMRCTAALVFTEYGGVRLATRAEIAEEQASVDDMRRHILGMHRQLGRP